MNENQKATTVGAIMLIAGGLIGAGLGLLYAPQSGKKTRRQMGRYSRKVRTEAEAMVRDSADAVRDAVENLADEPATGRPRWRGGRRMAQTSHGNPGEGPEKHRPPAPETDGYLEISAELRGLRPASSFSRGFGLTLGRSGPSRSNPRERGSADGDPVGERGSPLPLPGNAGRHTGPSSLRTTCRRAMSLIQTRNSKSRELLPKPVKMAEGAGSSRTSSVLFRRFQQYLQYLGQVAAIGHPHRQESPGPPCLTASSWSPSAKPGPSWER